MNNLILLQQLLIGFGFKIPDEELQQGLLGPETQRALRRVQEWLGLAASGELDEATNRAIIALACQHFLVLLGFEVGDDERWPAKMGDSTRQALMRFQEQHGLERTGELDRLTWDALRERAGRGRFTVAGMVADDAGQPRPAAVQAHDVNRDSNARTLLGQTRTAADGAYAIEYTLRQLRDLSKLRADLIVTAEAGGARRESDVIRDARGAETVDLVLPAGQPATCQAGVVSGQVRRADGPPLPAAAVRAFHEDDRGPIRLGEDTTDGDGRYTIRYELLPGMEAVALRVAAISRDGRTLQSSDVIRDAPSVAIVDLIVSVADRAQFVVEGNVASHSRAGIGDLRVVVVDKGVGGDVPVAETLTDKRGHYRAEFSGAALRERGKTQPDLQAHVYAGERFLAASGVRYDVRSRATLDVLLDEKQSAGLHSEYETLIDAVAPYYGGRLADLQETDARQDVTYLASKSGWDARAVALAALSDQFSARTADDANAAIAPSFFYALFRAGLPANSDSLYRTHAATAEAIWKRAIADGVIPSALEAQVPAAVERFRGLVVQRVLDRPSPAGLSPVKDILALSLDQDRDKHEQLMGLYLRHCDDLPTFWSEVRGAFGEQTEKRLRFDGQLAYLTLDNAALIGKLHSSAGAAGLTDTQQLVEGGYYKSGKWLESIGADPIPPNMRGGTDAARRGHYAEMLAAQVRLSHPTAVVAQMVKSGDAPVSDGTDGLVDRVHGFLAEHQASFAIGRQPVQQYIARHNVAVAPEVIHEVTRLQRVYQITPDDEAMSVLLKRGLDSAYAVTRLEQEDFVRRHATELGGEAAARLIHAKAQQVHNTVLNVAMSYLTAARAPAIGVHSPPRIMDPAPQGAAHAGDVIAYATLEGILGEMDFCDCEHCRSILSPAAYLVDLLMFLDRQPNVAGKENPQVVLFQRRPDIQHLPLTCENTNTAQPYIDLVNETLEYYITHSLSLSGYAGHNTDGSADAAELLAGPQFVDATAYDTLAAQRFPLPLPFHRSLETLRRYYGRFDAPLPVVMEALRSAAGNSLERPTPTDYGWRDIWMEELRLSRAEYDLLTDRNITLRELYGYPVPTAEADVLADLSSAKTYCRRTGITYEELADILRTRFINPGSSLIPRLERLGAPLSALKELKDGTLTDAQFDALLAPGLDLAAYGGDIKAWVRDDANYHRIMSLIMLANPNDEADLCSFDEIELRYANPDNDANKLRPFDYVRLLRFIRLWKKLDWSIDQTDKVITALFPVGGVADLEQLDAGFLTLLPRLGVLRRVMTGLRLKPATDLLPLLACFAPLDTHSERSLYRQMFLTHTLLQQDDAFADNGYGDFLSADEPLLFEHSDALRAAFRLTADEFGLITTALNYDASTRLKLAEISAIFRRGWLARKLKISVQEFLLLCRSTGLDPFASPDPMAPAILTLIDLLNQYRAVALKPAQVLYLIWNEDVSGKSAPAASEVADVARALRTALAAVETEFSVVDDPDGKIARARMTLVYGADAADVFFGLLDNTLATDVTYDHDQPVLAQPIIDAAGGRISYDDFRKRLTFAGALSTTTRDALLAVAGVSAQFQTAIADLYTENRRLVGPFFTRYPELEPLYEAYIASTDPPEGKRTTLLAAFLPALRNRRKRQAVRQVAGAASGADPLFVSAVLEDAAVWHAAADANLPALDDLTALEKRGLSLAVHFADTATGNADLRREVEARLDYAPGDNPLPPNGNDPAAAISAVWRGHLEAVENGFYNLSIEADAGATAGLSLDGSAVPLVQNGQVWSNSSPVELRAGRLYEFRLTVEKVKDRVALRWQTEGRGWQVVPDAYLYPATVTERLRAVYIRLLKAAALAAALRVTPAEFVHFAAHSDYHIDGAGWLNSLPDDGPAGGPTAHALGAALGGLLIFARLKTALSPDDERLLHVVREPTAATTADDKLLFTLTRWEPASLDALLSRFGHTVGGAADRAALGDLKTLARVHDAYDWVRSFGISASALIASVTNEPGPATVQGLQAALRARYDQSVWLEVQQAINDPLRGLQRDALVAYILHQMRADPDSAHINTPEKLFEYFLMDVQMEPCTMTSRVRHTLSSVQLFIERCLMNLEPRVSPSSLNAGHWRWMNRYRVWEANRKVFLYPENWLEPELRDDQSPFFREMMSELLQSDITDDRAAVALLNYLSKLGEVAKLVPCGIHYVEGAAGTADDIAHVVARTDGADRKYFYRRRQGGTWTAWEHIRLDIEDDPVLPVVWGNRLFLFWLRLIKESPLITPNLPPDDLSTVSANDVASQNKPQIVVKAILQWSEYFNGKWQPPRTSHVDQPLTLDTFNADSATAFNRANLKLSVLFWTDGELRLIVSDETGRGWGFFLYNTFSAPELRTEKKDRHFWPKRIAQTDGNTLAVDYPSSSTNHAVLTTNLVDRVIEPNHPLAAEPWNVPFFYGDARHVFYVTAEERFVTVLSWTDFGNARVELSQETLGIAPMVQQEVEIVPDLLGPIAREPGFGLVNPAPMRRFVTEDAYIKQGIGTYGTVSFNGVEIGPAGSQVKSVRTLKAVRTQ